MNENTKTIVIGSGFGGIAAALRLRALGMSYYSRKIIFYRWKSTSF